MSSPADRELWRELEAAPVVPVASLVDGRFARIRGTIAPTSDRILAPLTGRPCVAYHLAIVRATASGASWRWNTRPDQPPWQAVAARPFELRDASGAVHVVPGDPRVELMLPHHVMVFSVPFDASPEWRVVLEQFLRASPVCVSEGILEAGDAVTVGGVATAQPDPDGASRVASYRDHAPMRMVIAGSPRRPVLLTDRRRSADVLTR